MGVYSANSNSLAWPFQSCVLTQWNGEHSRSNFKVKGWDSSLSETAHTVSEGSRLSPPSWSLCVSCLPFLSNFPLSPGLETKTHGRSMIREKPEFLVHPTVPQLLSVVLAFLMLLSGRRDSPFCFRSPNTEDWIHVAQIIRTSMVIVVLKLSLCPLFSPSLSGLHRERSHSPSFSRKAICMFTGILLL